MGFRAIEHRMGVRTAWHDITHIRILRTPDMKHALERWEVLDKLADADRLVVVEQALAQLEPVRNLASGREASVRSDLRNWSNPSDHGNNGLNKGWIELGYLHASANASPIS